MFPCPGHEQQFGGKKKEIDWHKAKRMIGGPLVGGNWQKLAGDQKKTHPINTYITVYL